MIKTVFPGIKNSRLFLSYRLALRTGFTLIEIIFAIALLSMVVLLIGSGFRLGVKAWEKGETETIETQRLRALSGLISQQLKSAYPYKIKIEDEKVVVFKGDSSSIVFVTTLVDPGSGGFKWVKLSYKDRTLVYNEGIMPDKNFLEKIDKDEEIIDSDIGEVEFKYLSSEETEWKEFWEMGNELPSAVKVKIAFFQPFLITIPMSQIDEEDKDESKKLDKFAKYI